MESLDTIKFVLSLVPTLLRLVSQIEADTPQSGQGIRKLALVHDMLREIDGSLEQIWPLISK